MRTLLLVPLTALTLASLAQAQTPDRQPPGRVVGEMGLRGHHARPVGEFADFIDHGWGGSLSFTFKVTELLGLRGDLGFVNYGREEQDACLVSIGCRIALDLTTSNDIVFAGIGPELRVPLGPLRPYAFANAGIGYFLTTSRISGDADSHDFANTTNFDDLTFAWSAGGGLLIPVSSGKVPIAIDIGTQYHNNDVVRYLREGDIIDLPDGNISFQPIHSRANFLTYRVGLSLGLRKGWRN